jgi:hypothetical protein
MHLHEAMTYMLMGLAVRQQPSTAFLVFQNDTGKRTASTPGDSSKH